MAGALVTVTPRPLWRLRLRREASRYLVTGVAMLGLLASARYAIDPPAPTIVRAAAPSSLRRDPAAEGFAVLFARRYLSFQADEPEAHRQALAPYLSAEMEADAGFQPPEGVTQRVLWAEVVAAEAQAGQQLYTVAAQTEAPGAQASAGAQGGQSGLVYLSIGVVRTAGGALALAGYPAFVGPPTTAAAPNPAQPEEVQDGALATVVRRALRNYLAGSGSELAADLSPGARAATPSLSLTLEAVQSLGWEANRRSVLALVRARDQAGGRYTLAYRVYVDAIAGRWEIAGVELAPD